METEDIKLTEYSHGAGCGCKISPAVLETILKTETPLLPDARLLVGNDEKDDAAVYNLGNGSALISSTDFFMPIVNDAYQFGRIAATNSISDIYAMGGKPILAIAILGWPVNKIAPEIAQKVLDGARSVCKEAGITIAGGHSIDSQEPIFGLSVNGIVPIENLKRNSTATVGCQLYLTKPVGVGTLASAMKLNRLKPEDEQVIIDSMTTLNKFGEELGKRKEVKAMTDITGFGLLGHLVEMCEGSGVSAKIEFDKVPMIPSLPYYLENLCSPVASNRNWESYGNKIGEISTFQKQVLCDPQTSGGLLIAVEDNAAHEFEKWVKSLGYELVSFGKLTPKNEDKLISVI